MRKMRDLNSSELLQKSTANLILALDEAQGKSSIVPEYSRTRADEILTLR
jgi:hypothetical protein